MLIIEAVVDYTKDFLTGDLPKNSMNYWFTSGYNCSSVQASLALLLGTYKLLAGVNTWFSGAKV